MNSEVHAFAAATRSGWLLTSYSGQAYIPGMDRSAAPEIDLLAARFRAGDEAAFAAVFDGWSGAVFRLAARILRDDTEAEEVVEETFWQAWRNRESFDPRRGGMTAWLMTIARSRSLDRLRAAGRRPEVGVDQPVLEAVADPSLRDAAEVEELTRLVRGALAELGDDQREVIELAYFEGLTQSEIAERTAQPLGTVKTRVRLAMVKLRGRLGALGRDG